MPDGIIERKHDSVVGSVNISFSIIEGLAIIRARGSTT